MSAIAVRLKIAPLISEYDEKLEQAEYNIEQFKQQIAHMKTASAVQGAYGGMLMANVREPHLTEVSKSLRISAWRYLHKMIHINMIAPASDKAKFDRTIENPPEFNMDNIIDQFGDYFLNPRDNILRGLAEAFCGLDKAYKSHSNVRIGVSKLPKRAIIKNVFDEWGFSSYSKDSAINMINALRLYQNKGSITFNDLKGPIKQGKDEPDLPGYVETGLDGLSFKKFQNGNLHIIFDKDTCVDINKALAEYYGEVLPDAVDPEKYEGVMSTSLSKDLQFYPTPAKAARRLIRDVNLKGTKILEPSCGDGKLIDIMFEIAEKDGCFPNVFGYEVDITRADECRAKGYNVAGRNFLDIPPSPEFDYVVMNPPFSGMHYLKHIKHAIKFLKPGGVLRSILPATAWYDHGELPDDYRKWSTQWTDLPVGSFSESGTNVPTGIYEYISDR